MNEYQNLPLEQQPVVRKPSLHTVSMTELYDMAFPPRTPVIEGLLYSGTYLFAGSPKIGKSFFMSQLGYHAATGTPLWDYPVRQGSVYTWHWRMITAGCKGGSIRCLAWRP